MGVGARARVSVRIGVRVGAGVRARVMARARLSDLREGAVVVCALRVDGGLRQGRVGGVRWGGVG